ncbi:Maf family protein [Neisseria shayeganii]|nr:nucleoside triphosphate pyrophosphatase [Neisseria shayeganii]
MSALLYLASGSPRRREILLSLGFEVLRVAAEIDETPYSDEAPGPYALRLAQAKNRAAQIVARQQGLDDSVPLLTADTTVALNGRILGKPESWEDARAMLQALSGTVHQVFTAVCVSRQGKMQSVLQQSDVHFKTLTAAEIEAYLASGEPMDKAGAYGIQGLGGVFVRHLAGSFTGVMGLPVFETTALLADLGVSLPALASGRYSETFVKTKSQVWMPFKA